MKNLEENFQYDSQNRVFPATAQSVTYTGFDKADKIKQGNVEKTEQTQPGRR